MSEASKKECQRLPLDEDLACSDCLVQVALALSLDFQCIHCASRLDSAALKPETTCLLCKIPRDLSAYLQPAQQVALRGEEADMFLDKSRQDQEVPGALLALPLK